MQNQEISFQNTIWLCKSKQMISVKLVVVLIVVAIANFPLVVSADSYKFNELSKLVKKIIENEETPSVLWIKTCWSKSDEIVFIKSTVSLVQIVDSSAQINLSFEDEAVSAQWFFVDISCEQNSDFLMNVQPRYFAHPYRWIIAGATDDSIQNLTLLTDSNVILANQNAESKQYDLKQGKAFSHECFFPPALNC